MTGIDYGNGQTNIDIDTGIRYGVISSRALASHAWDEITSNGEDLDYRDFIESLQQDLSAAVKSVLTDYAAEFDSDAIAFEIIGNLDFDFESTGDCTRYLYDVGGLKFQVCSDGDIFVLKSPFYTFADFCSPCAPGAGYLGSDGNVKTYCLGPYWFDKHSPMPYRCFSL